MIYLEIDGDLGLALGLLEEKLSCEEPRLEELFPALGDILRERLLDALLEELSKILSAGLLTPLRDLGLGVGERDMLLEKLLPLRDTPGE